MIKQYFPAPVTSHGAYPYKKYWPAYTPNTSNVTDIVSKEAERAAKRGLSIDEYRARVVMVMREQSSVTFQVGDTVWPIYKKDIDTMGQCIITGFCRHFDDYGDIDWNDPPYLLSIRSLADKDKFIQCSVGFVTKTRPVIKGEIINEC